MSTKRALEKITAADVMQTDVTTIPATTGLGEVERILTEQDISGAPVTDHAGRIAGVLSLRDVVERIAEEDAARHAPGAWSAAIEERVDRRGAPVPPGPEAAPPPETAPPEEVAMDEVVTGPGAASTAKRLEPEGIAAEDREARELREMATGRAAPDRAEATAGDVMTAEIHAVPADASIPRLAAAMVEHRIHRVLVHADGKLVGMVSSMDVLRAVAAHQG